MKNLKDLLIAWWRNESEPAKAPTLPTLDAYVRAALAAARSAAGEDESLDDITGEGGVAAFRSAEVLALNRFFEIRDLVAAQSSAMRSDTSADPVVTAAMLAFGLGEDMHAEHQARAVIDQHLALLQLQIDPASKPKPVGRGRPSRTMLERAAVRGAMHGLHQHGRKFSSSWDYSERLEPRKGKRSIGKELLPTNDGSAAVLEAVKGAGIDIEVSTVRSLMNEYIRYLREEGKYPSDDDYTIDSGAKKKNKKN